MIFIVFFCICECFAIHKAKRLQIPQNIILIFLTPYSPELNPAEKIWAKFKRAFTNKRFYKLKHVSRFHPVRNIRNNSDYG